MVGVPQYHDVSKALPTTTLNVHTLVGRSLRLMQSQGSREPAINSGGKRALQGSKIADTGASSHATDEIVQRGEHLRRLSHSYQ